MVNYISLRQVMDNILDHPLLADLKFERAINYTQRFMRIVGIPVTFEEKTEHVEIKDYRGVLPCDLYKVIQVRAHRDKGHDVILRYTTDSFHMSNKKTDYPEPTYKLLNNCIFTSFKDGVVEIAYKAIATDCEGYPLIPDDELYINALEYYIKDKYFEVLFDLGKISPQVLQNTQLQYAWAVGQAQSSMLMPSLDEMESLSNSINTLLIRATLHNEGFVSDGTREHIKVH